MVDFLERIHSTGLDFQKAFDKVRHQRLLIKLKSRGMGVNIVTWIQNWLTDRKQRVSVEGISMDCSTQRGASRIGIEATTLPHLYKLLRRGCS